jgi:hypothetical protein
VTTAPTAAPDAAPDAASPKPGTRLERALVTVLLLAMIALPAASTLARRFLGRDLPGASVLAQHITLWVGFLGALQATASERHLGLSTLGVLAMTPMLAYLLSGHEAQIGKLMPLSEGPVILGMLVFLANVLRAWRTA